MHDNPNELTVTVVNKDSDQTVQLPSLIRVFAVCLKKPEAINYQLIALQIHVL